MVTGRFQIELPEGPWISDVSRAHPDARYRLLTAIEVEDGSIELGEVVGADPESAAAAVEAHEAVSQYERLHTGEDRILSQYQTSDDALYSFLREVAVPPEFPIAVENGWLECEVTAPREQIAAFRDRLEQTDGAYELRSIVDVPDADSLLTERQEELLVAAHQRGYYEVPRERTLTELAEEVGVDPSSASGVLRRAEERVVEWFLAHGPHDGER